MRGSRFTTGGAPELQTKFPQNNGSANKSERCATQNLSHRASPQLRLHLHLSFRRNQEGRLILSFRDHVEVARVGRLGILLAGPGDVVSPIGNDAIFRKAISALSRLEHGKVVFPVQKFLKAAKHPRAFAA